MPSPAPSNSPSEFCKQHHAVETPQIEGPTFRPGWRVKTRLDKLSTDSLISLAEWRAGLAFGAAAERLARVAMRTSAWNEVAVDKHCGTPGRAMSEAQLDAAARLRKVREALGPGVLELLTAHIVEDLSWCTLGQHCGVDRRTAKAWAIAAIKALAAI
jgi:hypothetical protein